MAKKNIFKKPHRLAQVLYKIIRGGDFMKVKTVEILAILSLFVLVLISRPIHAEIYKWIDEKGTVHFTQDPSTIPEKYHDKTESRTTEEDSMSIEERVKAKQRDEAEIKKRLKSEKNEYRPKGQEDRSRKIQKEASPANDTASLPSPGFIPHDKFIHLTNGMSEAEVLSRFGSPTNIEQDEAQTKGSIDGGTVSGYVSPGGSLSGTVSGGTIRSETTVIKRYYYIGDRSRGEKTTIIHIKKGRVFHYERI